MIELCQLVHRRDRERRLGQVPRQPEEVQSCGVATLAPHHHDGFLGRRGNGLNRCVQLRTTLLGVGEDPRLRPGLAVMVARAVATDAAIVAQPLTEVSQRPLELEHAQRLALELHLPDELLPSLRRQHAVGQPPGQREREQQPRSHGERREEALILACQRPVALDDIQQQAAVLGVDQDRGAGEAGEDAILRLNKEVPEAVQLVRVLRLRPHQVVRLVQKDYLVGVHVPGTFLVAYLHQR
mmetsp:Transcript_105599/g.305547  ORF Transcript_105599/g.305547 Transcript_105599/m.305547 type:complete len:240 (-) Transcript_105599:1700-2419(-)